MSHKRREPRARVRPAEPAGPICPRCRSPIAADSRGELIACYECLTVALPETMLGRAIDLQYAGLAGVHSVSVVDSLILAMAEPAGLPAHTRGERDRRRSQML